MVNFKTKIGETVYDLTSINENSTILDAKIHLSSLTNVDSINQKWIFKGRILGDNLTIKEANIEEDSCVIVMKVAGTKSNPDSLTNASTSIPSNSNGSSVPQVSTAPASTIALLQQAAQVYAAQQTSIFDQAMFTLLENSEEIVENAVGILIKIIDNIVSNPNNEKFRRIGTKNAAFSKKIGTVRGGNQCMSAIGFKLMNDDWILTPSGEAWVHLLQCREKLQKFSVKLQMRNSKMGVGVTQTTEETNQKAEPNPSDDVTSVKLCDSKNAEEITGITRNDVAAMQQLLQALQIMDSTGIAVLNEEYVSQEEENRKVSGSFGNS
jgi:hypothetical protein